MWSKIDQKETQITKMRSRSRFGFRGWSHTPDILQGGCGGFKRCARSAGPILYGQGLVCQKPVGTFIQSFPQTFPWFVVYGSLFVVSGFWFVVCFLWFVVCGLLFVVCCLWFLVSGLSKNKQKPLCVWFTGLSGSGKSTLIDALEIYLHNKNFYTYVLDGDNLRNGLCNDLDFSNESRDENLRRASEVAKLMLDSGLIVLAGFISPSLEQRARIRRLFHEDEFIEVYVLC